MTSKRIALLLPSSWRPSASPPRHAAKPGPDGRDPSEVYVGKVTPQQFEELRETGVDPLEISTGAERRHHRGRGAS